MNETNPPAPYHYEAGKIIGPPLNAWGTGYVPATIVCHVTAGDAGTGGSYSHYPAEVATRHIEIMLAALNREPAVPMLPQARASRPTLPDAIGANRLQEIADTTRQSASHIRAALETMPEPASFHFGKVQDFDRAAAEHRERLAKLQAVLDDLDTLAHHLEPVPVPAEPAQLLRVFYVCPRCSHEWDEEYSCACDSECPECNLENIEADRWEDIDATPETEAKD